VPITTNVFFFFFFFWKGGSLWCKKKDIFLRRAHLEILKFRGGCFVGGWAVKGKKKCFCSPIKQKIHKIGGGKKQLPEVYWQKIFLSGCANTIFAKKKKSKNIFKKKAESKKNGGVRFGLQNVRGVFRGFPPRNIPGKKKQQWFEQKTLNRTASPRFPRIPPNPFFSKTMASDT